MKTLSLLTLSMFLCAAAHAELKWDQTLIELHPGLNDKTAVAHFKYENVGKKAVRFKSVHASCGCTAAQTQKEEVAPGEKGEVTATYSINGHTGTQVKTVTVETDEAAQGAAITLTLRAVMAEALTISPAFVYWNAGEEAKPKTIVAKADKNFPVKDLKVSPSGAGFEVQVQPNGDHEWKINVKPKDTAQPINGVLNIMAEQNNAPARTFYANVRVMPSAPAQPSSGTR